MKSLRFPPLSAAAAVAILLLAPAAKTARAQDPAAAPETATSAASAAPAPELEAKFIAALTNARLQGRWTPIKDGQLGPEKEDSYEIVSVAKVGGDRWTVHARLSYAGKSLVLPLPVLVKWAGDTPLLIVDQLSLGFGPKYSARILFYGNTYAGTWSGGDHGGLLSGLIVPAAR